MAHPLPYQPRDEDDGEFAPPQPSFPMRAVPGVVTWSLTSGLIALLVRIAGGSWFVGVCVGWGSLMIMYVLNLLFGAKLHER